MPYTNNHQSKSYTFPRQPNTHIEQQFSTSGLVYSIQRTTSVPPAVQTRISPLDVYTDISRNNARLPFQPIGEWPNHSTQTRLAKRGSERDIFLNTHSRTSAQRTNTGSQTYSPGHKSGRGVQLYPESSQTTEALTERPRVRGVRQDKARFLSARMSVLQPARMTGVIRAVYPNNPVVRSQTVSEARHKLTPVTLWVDQPVKAHLETIAREEGLSISAAGAAFLRKSLQHHIDLEYSATLDPVFERLIAKYMRGISTHLSSLLVRTSIDSGQTRILATNILGRQPGMTTDLLKSIVNQSGETARGNITRRTPSWKKLSSQLKNGF